MARPPQDPQKRINEILNAAEPLFYLKGYHDTAISDIAKKMGVAQGTIYYYFTSKEELLEALVSRVLSESMAKIKIAVHSADSSAEKFQIALQTLFETLHCEEGLIFQYLYNDQTIHIIDRLSRNGKRQLAPILLKIIETGCKEGCYYVLQTETTLNIILSIIDSLIEAIYERLSPELLNSQFQLAEELIAYALGIQSKTFHIVKTQ